MHASLCQSVHLSIANSAMLLWDRQGNCELALILSYLDVADGVIENVIAQSIEFLSACYLLLLLVCHAPLGARSAKRRHQSPESTLLSHINASSRERLLDFRSCWIVFIHVVRWCPGGFVQFSEWEAVMIFLASVSFVVSAMWPNRERRRAWTIANRLGCPVVPLTASFRRWWYHLIPNSFRKHHWSRASILSARNINWRFGHKTSSSPPKLCLSSSNHWDVHSEC